MRKGGGVFVCVLGDGVVRAVTVREVRVEGRANDHAESNLYQKCSQVPSGNQSAPGEKVKLIEEFSHKHDYISI